MAAIDLIVDAYVRAGDRQALEVMLDGRRRLAAMMRDRHDFHFGVPLEAIDRDVLAITNGLARLNDADATNMQRSDLSM